MTNPSPAGSARFYRAFVTADMFGGWSLVREWGERGIAGHSRTDWFECFDDALETLRQIARRKEREGFYALQMTPEIEAPVPEFELVFADAA